MPRSDEETLTDEIEVTPEMIEAGVSALLEFDRRFESEDAAVRRIYEAMSSQRRDAMLLRLLKTPPQSRAELAEQVRRAKGKKPTRTRVKRASAAS